jgi:hypothetical protein
LQFLLTFRKLSIVMDLQPEMSCFHEQHENQQGASPYVSLEAEPVDVTQALEQSCWEAQYLQAELTDLGYQCDRFDNRGPKNVLDRDTLCVKVGECVLRSRKWRNILLHLESSSGNSCTPLACRGEDDKLKYIGKAEVVAGAAASKMNRRVGESLKYDHSLGYENDYLRDSRNLKFMYFHVACAVWQLCLKYRDIALWKKPKSAAEYERVCQVLESLQEGMFRLQSSRNRLIAMAIRLAATIWNDRYLSARYILRETHKDWYELVELELLARERHGPHPADFKSDDGEEANGLLGFLGTLSKNTMMAGLTPYCGHPPECGCFLCVPQVDSKKRP